MAFGGFEKDRMTLKYRRPAAAYGFECPDRTECGASGYGRIARVAMALGAIRAGEREKIRSLAWTVKKPEAA